MRIVHVISDLTQGGAETVLYRLAVSTPAHDHLVISLGSHGHVGPHLEAAGIRVESLGMARGRFTLAGFRELRRLIRDFTPDVVQTRLHHANLVGGLAARLERVPVVWGLHATWLGTFRTTWKTRAVRRFSALLSHFVPRSIVYDAERSRVLHARLGYSRRRSVVVDNGVDLTQFAPDPSARARTRGEWGISDDQVLFGCVARWDPLKDHENLLTAFAKISTEWPGAHCVLIGREMTPENRSLTDLLNRLNIRDRVSLVGLYSDAKAAFNALDVHVLASVSESAPMTVIEALACGVRCVVTDVGDSARLVGEVGWVVPPRAPDALAAAMAQAAGADRADASTRSRARAEAKFGVGRMVERYECAWRGEQV